MYNGTINEFTRADLVRKLKAYFGELLATAEQFPLVLRTVFICPEDEIGDLDNARWFYEKVFIDSLKSKGIRREKSGDTTYLNYKGRPLPDDTVKYLHALRQEWYESKQKVLVFELYEHKDAELEKEKLFSSIFDATGLEL